jgi:hypothetical protein
MPAQEEEKARPPLDFQAIARVARWMELREIRLAEISASGAPRPRKPLEPKVTHDCIATRREGKELEVTCSYRFTVHTAARDEEKPATKKEIATADFKYVILYDVQTDESFSDVDIQQFAYANGTYHSWPFVRQLLFDLTSRMGYQPFSLPTFRFNPKPPPKAPPEPLREPSATKSSPPG